MLTLYKPLLYEVIVARNMSLKIPNSLNLTNIRISIASIVLEMRLIDNNLS